jgi:hypothetical protein
LKQHAEARCVRVAQIKILTRYVSSRRDPRLLVVYSETHLQPKVQRFLEDLEARPASVWD